MKEEEREEEAAPVRRGMCHWRGEEERKSQLIWFLCFGDLFIY